MRLLQEPHFFLAAMRQNNEIEDVLQLCLREFRPHDLDALWDLDQVCFAQGISYSKEELLHYIHLKNGFTFIAECETPKEAKLCGFIIGQRRRGGFGHVLTIDVDPAFRQQGIGSTLLRGAHARLASESCHTIFLEVAVNNLSAIAFYKRHGYVIVRTLPRYYHATGVDAFLLSCRLAPAGGEKDRP